MSARINLTLEASEMFFSRHLIFSLERAAIVWAILERIRGFDPSLEMIAPRYLNFSTSFTPWPFILISLWKPFGLFVITLVLSGPISILYLVVVVSRRSTRTQASSSASAFAGRPDSLVGKTVCLCLTISYIPIPQGEKYINENPCGMYEWFDCPCRVAVDSQSISRAAENYPGLPPPQDSRANASLEAELLGLKSIP